MLARTVALACVAGLVAPSTALAQLKATSYVTGLSSPIAFIQDTADPANQFVVQQGGRIRLVRNGVLQGTDFANLSTSILSGGERGLLGMALAPDWATSGRFFVYFTNPNGDIVVRACGGIRRIALQADPAYPHFDLQWSTGERVIRHPVSRTTTAATSRSGRTAISTSALGDGGSGNDPPTIAQNPASLLGKMLRIDVSVPDSDPAGLAIPAAIPFLSGGGCARRSGASACAIPGAGASTTRRAAAPAR